MASSSDSVCVKVSEIIHNKSVKNDVLRLERNCFHLNPPQVSANNNVK